MECGRLQAEVHELTHWSRTSFLDLAQYSLLVLVVHVSDAVQSNSKISLEMQRDLMISHYSRKISPWIIQARAGLSVGAIGAYDVDPLSCQGGFVDADDDRPGVAVTFMHEGISSLSNISGINQLREAGL